MCQRGRLMCCGSSEMKSRPKSFGTAWRRKEGIGTRPAEEQYLLMEMLLQSDQAFSLNTSLSEDHVWCHPQRATKPDH